MNEKIKQLAQNAGSIYDPQEGIQVFNKEKFAELIIRECVEHLTTTDFNDIVPGGNIAVVVAASDLLEYFGVEYERTN